ncbi:MAG TPA: nuclease-related domain-containing protein [Acidimicrobiales bacterium]|nr:nuclease-related domain-containing protein [Acidimicrobiales bacterium]
MSETFSVQRWHRYGHDRLYVSAPDGSRAGWLCLVTGELDVEDGADRLAVLAALDGCPEAAPFVGQLREEGASAPAPPVDREAPACPRAAEEVSQPAAAVSEPQPTGEIVPEDLALRRPGASARRRAEEEQQRIRRETPVAGLVARLLDLNTEERSWRIGAGGESAIGRRLERLGRGGWRVLHAIPVGERGADIDHLLIGPGGVYTINTKNHPGKRIWVGGNVVMVNGCRVPYVRNARHEAMRAARLLSGALGHPVAVRAALVLLTRSVMPDVTIAEAPADVMVLDRMDVPRVFRLAPVRLETSEVEAIFSVARSSRTWRSSEAPPAQDGTPQGRRP